MKKAAILVGAVWGLALLAAGPAQAKRASVTIYNQSDWEIHQFFLSSTDDEEWGPDQLGERVIGTDQSFTLTDIPCDSYDVMIVDEDGDECVLTEVDLCGDKSKWVITNKELLHCQKESE